jgi:hypothetical protein
MMFDLRIVAISASLVLASIAVAAADNLHEQPLPVAVSTSGPAGEARPIRVVLPAPWEPAPASSGSTAATQK